MFELVEIKISYHKQCYGVGAIVGMPAKFAKEWNGEMEPDVGLDVSKGTNQAFYFVK